MKKYCDNCGIFHDVKIKEEKRTYQVKGIDVTAKIKITYCMECNQEVYNKEVEMQNDIIMFDGYKEQKELLT